MAVSSEAWLSSQTGANPGATAPAGTSTGTGQQPLPEVSLSEFGGKFAAEALEKEKEEQAAKAAAAATATPPVQAKPGEKLQEEKPKEEAQPQAKVYAGEFKTTEELETEFVKQKGMYQASSEEGKRLHKEKVALRDQLIQAATRLQLVNLEKEIGTFKEATKEELEAMDENGKRIYGLEKKHFDERKERLLA